ncbi:MAG: hypothetical protein K2M03_08405, partial [Muribaculaceae bacterium]|nr:hypothetical protein [Muribaculaceae bacterium]
LYKFTDMTNHGWDFRNQYILQTADIELNAPFEEWGEKMPELWTPIGKAFETGRAFTFAGNYDGGLHTVANMYMEDNVPNYAGLFGVIADGANICNLGVTDAFIRFENVPVKGGILVGSAALWNDDSTGERHISNCMTSGHIEGTDVSGFIGGGSQWGKTVIDNSYTTAEIYSYSGGGGFFATEVVGDMPVYVNASYFNGTFVRNGYGRYPMLFNECNVTNSYFSTDAYPVTGDYEYYAYGRTSEYMNTPEFVNELSYASSYFGLVSPWRYTAGQTASFVGRAPDVEVTYNFGDEKSVSFNAFKESYLKAPVVTGSSENMVLNGWFDSETTGIFDFTKDKVTSRLHLVAQWSQMLQPDYTPFKNKFSKTYTIKTPEQLLALSYIVNGVSDEVAQTDYEGYTIQLGNDIVWNDTEDYDLWGESWTPMPFCTIGGSDKHFAGTFDGQGHKITGLYINKCGVYGGSNNLGMFPYIPSSATVKNLILDKAYIEVGFTYDKAWAGLLAGVSYGSVDRCGAEGRIVATEAANPEGYVGGLIALTSGNMEKTTLNECYAVVESKLNRHNFGGLVFSTSGNINDSYARSVVNWKDYGWFGGIACIQQGSAPNNTKLHNVWCASEISWQFTFGREDNPGGAVYGSDYTGNTGAYYDRTLLGNAFGPEADWTGNRYNPYLMGTGLSTEEMQRMSSFTHWDFNNVWGRRNDTNSGYPYLRWTSPALDNDADSDLTGIENVMPDSDTVITLYDMYGLQVYSGRMSECSVSAGIYIMRTPERSCKIVVR